MWKELYFDKDAKLTYYLEGNTGSTANFHIHYIKDGVNKIEEREIEVTKYLDDSYLVITKDIYNDIMKDIHKDAIQDVHIMYNKNFQ
jgi:hypothetical protein